MNYYLTISFIFDILLCVYNSISNRMPFLQKMGPFPETCHENQDYGNRIIPGRPA